MLAFSIQGGSRGGSDDETVGTKCAGYWNMFFDLLWTLSLCLALGVRHDDPIIVVRS